MTARELFGCRHTRTTFPMTLRGPDGEREPCHVCCLVCGAKLEYDFDEMKIGKEIAA